MIHTHLVMPVRPEARQALTEEEAPEATGRLLPAVQEARLAQR